MPSEDGAKEQEGCGRRCTRHLRSNAPMIMQHLSSRLAYVEGVCVSCVPHKQFLLSSPLIL